MLCVVAALLAGCGAPSARLTFPAPLGHFPEGTAYDVHHRGRADFLLMEDGSGRVNAVAYDDAGDGHWNRVYRLDDYPNDRVPHLIILLDSVPYEAMAAWYRAGHLRMFDPPQKVIPPFPSLTEICYGRLLDCPPLPGLVDDYYIPDAGIFAGGLWQRVLEGYQEPWERKLDYTASMFEAGLTYLHPREWYAAELERAREAFDASSDRVTLVYFASASSMLSRFGKPGLDEVLDGIERMCVQILYERQGAVKISMMADHGHNLMATKNVSLTPALEAAGFKVTDKLEHPNDVVIELHGLVTYTGVHTTRPAAVSKALCADPKVTLAVYMDGARLVVESAKGRAAIERTQGRLRYAPVDADPLGYAPVVESLRASGKADAEEYVSEEDWFHATLAHEYPDAPQRLWDAFHGTVTHPPEVMVTVRDGYCAGREEFERFIHMASTHGSLNQANSATFLMTMTRRVREPLRTGDILRTIEPGWTPRVHGSDKQ